MSGFHLTSPFFWFVGLPAGFFLTWLQWRSYDRSIVRRQLEQSKNDIERAVRREELRSEMRFRFRATMAIIAITLIVVWYEWRNHVTAILMFLTALAGAVIAFIFLVLYLSAIFRQVENQPDTSPGKRALAGFGVLTLGVITLFSDANDFIHHQAINWLCAPGCPDFPRKSSPLMFWLSHLVSIVGVIVMVTSAARLFIKASRLKVSNKDLS